MSFGTPKKIKKHSFGLQTHFYLKLITAWPLGSQPFKPKQRNGHTYKGSDYSGNIPLGVLTP